MHSWLTSSNSADRLNSTTTFPSSRPTFGDRPRGSLPSPQARVCPGLAVLGGEPKGSTLDRHLANQCQHLWTDTPAPQQAHACRCTLGRLDRHASSPAALLTEATKWRFRYDCAEPPHIGRFAPHSLMPNR